MSAEKKPLVSDKSVNIVIEGYPRSANTFAVVAFQYEGNQNLRIAHHTHVPATVLDGCSRGVPAIVLIRKPVDAVVSAAIYTGRSPKQLLKEWIWFYRTCWAVHDDFIAAPFELVVKDFGSIIECVNERWGKCYVPFSATEENVAGVMSRINEIAYRFGQGEERVARPSAKREKYKAAIQAALRREPRLLYESNEIYEKYKDC